MSQKRWKLGLCNFHHTSQNQSKSRAK